jgi:hypothetical protein
MTQLLDSGELVTFGQDVKEVENLCSRKVEPTISRAYRQGIDTVINLPDVSLRFDTGRLVAIEFQFRYQYEQVLTPYREEWKNFVPVDGTRISCGMPRRAFLAYLGAWDKRARSLGARRRQSGDLASGEYAIMVDRTSYCDMIHVSLGPTRRTGGSGRWCDGWTALFTTELDRHRFGGTVGLLESLAAFRDEFNTFARRRIS